MSDDLIARLLAFAGRYLHRTATPLLLTEAADEIARLRAENADLREALGFYADPSIYKPHPHGPAFDRGGDLSFRARAALNPGAAT